MASITSFTVGTITNTSAQFSWTLDIEATDPQQEAYTLFITAIGHPTINVTYASLPYTLTGLQSGTSYDVDLVLDYGGAAISSAVKNIKTTGAGPTPPTSPRTITSLTTTPGPGSVTFTYTLAGTDAYTLTFYGGSNPVDVTHVNQPVTLGLSANTDVTVTLSCLSDGKTTSLSHTIHTGTLPPAPIRTLDPDFSSVDALLVGSDIGSDHTRLVVAVFLSNSGVAYNLSQNQNGTWNAPLKLGGNYAFYPRGAVVTQVLANNDFVYQARTFGVGMNLNAQGNPGPMQEVTNQSFSTPASLGGLFISATAVASAAHDSLDVFGLGTDSNLYHKHITDPATQTNWAQIGLNLTGSPVAVVATPGLIELLAIRNGDLEVLHATFNPSTNAISAWTQPTAMCMRTYPPAHAVQAPLTLW